MQLDAVRAQVEANPKRRARAAELVRLAASLCRDKDVVALVEALRRRGGTLDWRPQTLLPTTTPIRALKDVVREAEPRGVEVVVSRRRRVVARLVVPPVGEREGWRGDAVARAAEKVVGRRAGPQVAAGGHARRADAAGGAAECEVGAWIERRKEAVRRRAHCDPGCGCHGGAGQHNRRTGQHNGRSGLGDG